MSSVPINSVARRVINELNVSCRHTRTTCLTFVFFPYYLLDCVLLFVQFVTFSFQQEVPSRVVKLILKATDENNDGLISVQEVENLLTRIGAQDQLSKEEIEDLMMEMGIDEGAAGVSVTKKVKEILMPPPKAK